MHFKFNKKVISQKVLLEKFQKVGTKSVISVFPKLVFSSYFEISHDPLDQSNLLRQANFKPHVSRKLKRKLLKNLKISLREYSLIYKHNQKLINIFENQKIYGGFFKILIFRVSLSRTHLPSKTFLK